MTKAERRAYLLEYKKKHREKMLAYNRVWMRKSRLAARLRNKELKKDSKYIRELQIEYLILKYQYMFYTNVGDLWNTKAEISDDIGYKYDTRHRHEL